MPLTIVILAAGQGTRMRSARPKVLHELAGKPLLQHVVDSGRALEPEQIIVVVGHGAEQVQTAMQGQGLYFVGQREQLGTGHALQQCLNHINTGNAVLVLYGDVPLVRAETMARMIENTGNSAVCILNFEPGNPFGYGRVVRKQGLVQGIVEQKDASVEQQAIGECFSGTMLIRGDKLQRLVSALENNNAQQEYYLTDVVGIAVSDGDSVSAVVCEDANEVTGVNNQQQLASVEAMYRAQQAEALMSQGVKICDPARIDLRGHLEVGRDVQIDVNCVFEGTVSLGDNVCIGANCVIRNTSIAAGSVIQPMTWIDEAVIGGDVSIGPFARIRAGTECGEGVKIGNFVETKKAHIGDGSKISHLSYIGDTDMGSEVNIGAGTITCNYDGVNKFKTVIEDGVFIGSDTQLVAPVTVSRNATVGAGSTITRNVPADTLAVSRARQVTVNSWSRPVKQQKDK